jgi:hypothetical protein
MADSLRQFRNIPKLSRRRRLTPFSDNATFVIGSARKG